MLVIGILVLASMPSTVIGQSAERHRITFSAGHSVPVAGYGWGDAGQWSGQRHFHARYDHLVMPLLMLGVSAAIDEQRLKHLSLRGLGAAARVSYAGMDRQVLAIAPFVELGAVAIAYRSDVTYYAGSQSIAPRGALGIAVTRRLVRGLTLAGEVEYQIVADQVKFEPVGFDPRPEPPPPSSFRYATYRIGLQTSF
jgi:hypothetical protein